MVSEKLYFMKYVIVPCKFPVTWNIKDKATNKQHQAYSAPSDVDMNTREQSAATKKTVVENATRELVLEHACELVGTFPISKEKALILSVIRSWDSLDSITKKRRSRTSSSRTAS